MQPYITLTRRELGGFFVSITGYVIIAGAIFLVGLSYVAMLQLLQGTPTPTPITQLFYSTGFFWLIVTMSTPVITMRLFALEKYSGTFETLMTTPVSDLQVVLSKFSAAIIFYMLMWLPYLGFILILQHYIQQPGTVDAGILGSTFLGIFLVGSLFMSIGCFASALTRSQIIAAMVCIILLVSWLLLSYLPAFLTLNSGWQSAVISYVGLFDQMNDFVRGLIDSRHIVFFVTTTFLFLFFTLRVVESRRWK